MCSRVFRYATQLSLLLVFASLMGCTTITPHQAFSMREFEYPVWTRRFPSGLRVIAERDTRTPNVAIVLVVGAGSSADPLGKEGLAHFVEHSAFSSRPEGKTQFVNLLERAGCAEWNAYTSFDETVYTEIGPKQSLAPLLKLEGLRMVDAVRHVPVEKFGAALDVVRNEFRQHDDTAFSGDVFGVMQGMLFPKGHRYARPVAGTHGSLSSFTPDDVATFIKQHYRPDNMTLQIVGSIELESIENQVLQSLPKEFLEKPASINAPRATIAPKPPPDSPTPAFVKAPAAVVTPELWLGWTLPPAIGLNRAKIHVAELIIGGALRDISEEDSDIGLVQTSLFTGEDASVLFCRARLTNGDHPDRSADLILRRIAEFTEPPGIPAHEYTKELEFVEKKNAAIVNSVLDAEDILSRGFHRALLTHRTQDVLEYSRTRENITSLEKADVVEFFTTYLSRERARMALFLPRVQGAEPSTTIGFDADLDDDGEPLSLAAAEEELTRLSPGLGARKYASMKLENGLELIFAERPGLPVVTIELRLKSNHAEVEDLGAAHVGIHTSYMFDNFYGNPAAFGARYRRKYDRFGSLSYSMTGASGNADIMLGLVAETRKQLGVIEDQWERFQKSQMPFLEKFDRQPAVVAETSLLESLFRGSRYGRTITMAQWAKVTPERVEQWLGDTHVANNAVVVIAGEFDRRTVEPIAREYLGEWGRSSKTSSPAPAIVPAEKPSTEPHLIVVNRAGSTQAEITFGCILPPAYNGLTEVRHDLDAALLADRVHQIVREKGSTSALYTKATVLRGGTAYLRVEGVAETSKLAYSLAALKKALDHFSQNPVDARVLAQMKLRLARRNMIRTMSNQSIADAVANARALDQPFADLDDFAVFLGKTTAPDIQADFAACFSGRPTLSIVGDERTARAAFKEAWQTSVEPARRVAHECARGDGLADDSHICVGCGRASIGGGNRRECPVLSDAAISSTDPPL